MKADIKSVSITIDEREALGIINAMNKWSTDQILGKGKNENDYCEREAMQFLGMLKSIFQNSVAGVHRPDKS